MKRKRKRETDERRGDGGRYIKYGVSLSQE